MPINWGKLISNAAQVGLVLGVAAIAIKAIDDEIAGLVNAMDDAAILTIAGRAASLDNAAWSTYAQALQRKAQVNNNARVLLEVGSTVRNEMARVATLLSSYPSPTQAAEMAVGMMYSMDQAQQFGFSYALQHRAATGDIRASAVLGFMRRALQG